jgi:hypothetical protein
MRVGTIHRSTFDVLAMVIAACGFMACSGDDPAGEDGDVVATDLCSGDTKAEPFSAGMTKTTKGGLTIAVLSADPAPPARGRNSWTVEVKDATGAALVGADVQAFCTMFHAGGGSHGCVPSPSVAEEGEGQYAVYPIGFNMHGHWEVSVGVVESGEVEEVKFPLCIE